MQYMSFQAMNWRSRAIFILFSCNTLTFFNQFDKIHYMQVEYHELRNVEKVIKMEHLQVTLINP